MRRGALTLALAAATGLSVAALGAFWVGGRGGAEVLSAPSGPPRLGAATDFTLPDQAGGAFRLADHRGEVVIVNFMFTRCADICPVLQSKLAAIQEDLSASGIGGFHIVSVTVDPVHDDAVVLSDFAANIGADTDSWSFVTGEVDAVRAVASAYGVYMADANEGNVAHSLLTTVIDAEGVKRVQYLGERFDHRELQADITALIVGSAAEG